MNFLFSQRNETFKPRKAFRGGSRAANNLQATNTATLGSGNLRDAVKLPVGEDENEWIAVNIVDFFNQINMLYGTLLPHKCNEKNCSNMTAGSKFEYFWMDGNSMKKPVRCSAPKYIDYLMTWVQEQLDDEDVFPSKIGVPFPKNFKQVAKTVMKRLFRVYAHVYHHHWDSIQELKEEAHVNTSFKHFMLFTNEFKLIESKELEPLHEIIERLALR